MLFFISYLDPSRMHHLYKVEYEGEGGGGVFGGGVGVTSISLKNP